MTTPIENTLIDLYVQFDTPVDELPYTETLASITATLNTKQSAFITAGTVWNMLVYMEKSGKLPDIRHEKCSTIRKRVEKLVDLLQSPEADTDRSVCTADDWKCIKIRQKVIDELVGLSGSQIDEIVENVEASVGGPHGEGHYNAEDVINVVKGAINWMSKKGS